MSVFHGLSGGKIVHAVLAGVAVGVGGTAVRVGEGARVGVDVGFGVAVGGAGVAVGGGGNVAVRVGVDVGIRVGVGVRVGAGLRLSTRASDATGTPSWTSSPIASATKAERMACRGRMPRFQSKFGTARDRRVEGESAVIPESGRARMHGRPARRDEIRHPGVVVSTLVERRPAARVSTAASTFM
jgi:hypothetical protein